VFHQINYSLFIIFTKVDFLEKLTAYIEIIAALIKYFLTSSF